MLVAEILDIDKASEERSTIFESIESFREVFEWEHLFLDLYVILVGKVDMFVAFVDGATTLTVDG